MKTNTRTALMDRTHEGAPIPRITPEQELRRFALTAMLWEKTFYESGDAAVQRIREVIPKVAPEKVAELAVQARNNMYLRHTPLFLARELARRKGNGPLVSDLLVQVIQRADELAEFVALYWREKRQPLSAGVKRGLAAAYQKFGAYELAKYNRAGAVKLRDVLFLCHAKPKDEAQAEVFRQLVEGTLSSPDTWEVALTTGADKKKTFTRLLQEGKLGGLAALRNLRGMIEAGVPDDLIRERLERGTPGVLPWQYIAAANHAPRFESSIEVAMLKSLEGMSRLEGTTALLIDVSGSMQDTLSGKSMMTRLDAARGLAILLREKCARAYIGTFSGEFKEVPDRRGFALSHAIDIDIWGGTYLRRSMAGHQEMLRRAGVLPVQRLIVITDGQSMDGVATPYGVHNYMVNIAPYANGVGARGGWVNIDGFSDRIVDFIHEYEREPVALD
jgi:60 kDa SS-A/Ro ribonucleoprotein